MISRDHLYQNIGLEFHKTQGRLVVGFLGLLFSLEHYCIKLCRRSLSQIFVQISSKLEKFIQALISAQYKSRDIKQTFSSINFTYPTKFQVI